MSPGSQLPESLRRLADAWHAEGASLDEIVCRLDQLELLAHEERALMVERMSDNSGPLPCS